jgi:hypothetical protein
MMSSAAAKGAVSQAPSASDESPSMQPVQLLHSTGAARALNHIEPGLISLAFAIRFKSLVEDPVASMGGSLAFYTVFQFLYVIFCLPVAGSLDEKAIKKARPGEKKKAESTGPNPIVVSVSIYQQWL